MKNLDLTIREPEELAKVARALGSEVRLRIMQLLGDQSMSVVELAEAMGVPLSTVSNNIVVLEEAGLIRTERKNGLRGTMKLCSRKRDQIYIDLVAAEQRKIESFFQYMPIGNYTDCHIVPTCGMAGTQSSIGVQDDTALFYEPEHIGAQLLWFQGGYVEYRFSSRHVLNRKLHCLEVSFEACSEAPNYRLDWPSDITVWINGIELGTWRCPGDFGGRQGRCTPIWWPRSATQYGIVKRWRVDESGCKLDDERISSVTLEQLRLKEHPYITLRIGIKEDAEQQGGNWQDEPRLAGRRHDAERHIVRPCRQQADERCSEGGCQDEQVVVAVENGENERDEVADA